MLSSHNEPFEFSGLFLFLNLNFPRREFYPFYFGDIATFLLQKYLESKMQEKAQARLQAKIHGAGMWRKTAIDSQIEFCTVANSINTFVQMCEKSVWIYVHDKHSSFSS